ncbi:TetR/AcrR family transcriptional regulator [Parvibaculaceae bacterium PLY_AMNH_Bact1]|nr:TetR/AcrR family transcriptional regulator [Parvibaculaceae bacterium PLY_AMNH_Bact1]
MSAKPKELGKTDWIAAAFRALVAGGPSAINVEPLAKSLGVTKGSFYWHFKDRAALHTAMLDHWEKIATDHIIDDVETHGGSGRAKLERLINHAVSAAPDAYGGAQAEGVLRGWAASYDPAGVILARVDKRRRAYLAQLFQEAGLAKADARHAADIAYLASIGAQNTRATGGKMDRPATWGHLLDQLLKKN